MNEENWRSIATSMDVSKRKKPHLLFFNGTWICWGGSAAGRALTAKAAYANWSLDRMMHRYSRV